MTRTFWGAAAVALVAAVPAASLAQETTTQDAGTTTYGQVAGQGDALFELQPGTVVVFVPETGLLYQVPVTIATEVCPDIDDAYLVSDFQGTTEVVCEVPAAVAEERDFDSFPNAPRGDGASDDGSDDMTGDDAMDDDADGAGAEAGTGADAGTVGVGDDMTPDEATDDATGGTTDDATDAADDATDDGAADAAPAAGADAATGTGADAGADTTTGTDAGAGAETTTGTDAGGASGGASGEAGTGTGN
ncbi:hypothetical protein [Rubellimicrobium sp. CFH 75288]|uniref:hypothetical protein n=1 Tax=Rubellimicrobium sp. CFH 75288 TaxID=2697034 RepID=UPI0014128678|nr:hypothetical protein [Rubellimicrobium sp. CFH 75288]NAZ36596.1 hypothetical protein [Rubellimicrobium sp. CFH 75288]